jgi:hypothetical protein
LGNEGKRSISGGDVELARYRGGFVESDLLETDYDTYGVVQHLHGQIFGSGWESSAEDGLLQVVVCTGCDYFLDLREKLWIEHAVCLVENEMPDADERLGLDESRW